jgi:hypothetical protein
MCWAGLLAVTVNTIAWVAIAMAGCQAFGISDSPLIVFGVGLSVVSWSSVGLSFLRAVRLPTR